MNISQIMSTLTEIFYQVVDYVGWTGSFVVNHPLVLLFALVPLVGLGVGMFKRLINVN